MNGPPDNLGRSLASWRGQRVLIALMAGLYPILSYLKAVLEDE